MQDAGILLDFAGIVVSDRHQNYFTQVGAHHREQGLSLAHPA